MLAPDAIESLANGIGYTIKEGWTHIYRGFHRTDLYIDKSGRAWISSVSLLAPSSTAYIINCILIN